MKSYQITEYVHHFLENHIQSGNICIDATMGNGHDTLKLCELVGNTGKVYAFDIQETAVANTKKLLEDQKVIHIASLILDSHTHMHNYVMEKEVDCIVFNFGYLPSGDHSLATKANTSIEAITQGLSLLRKGGLMSLCIYSGGDSGFDERDALLAFLKELEPKNYLVILSSYYNRPNNPPIPVMIIKK
ncbi:MAG: class I SAM-dependent methyltransferase [Lachnospiraceae bacterium]|nr:class I SAM-dependent methyltransferase [Lachnospiraceae bacterium]